MDAGRRDLRILLVEHRLIGRDHCGVFWISGLPDFADPLFQDVPAMVVFWNAGDEERLHESPLRAALPAQML
ncbi:hypothetical protein GCM10009727_89050 [Actinomadura napierensis]|uniref:DUF3037 domain-containing protein n=1 Tax=Actinomadura napierensis TaxID=267854 RepID=A0ABP5M941_9ACTN